MSLEELPGELREATLATADVLAPVGGLRALLLDLTVPVFEGDFPETARFYETTQRVDTAKLSQHWGRIKTCSEVQGLARLVAPLLRDDPGVRLRPESLQEDAGARARTMADTIYTQPLLHNALSCLHEGEDLDAHCRAEAERLMRSVYGPMRVRIQAPLENLHIEGVRRLELTGGVVLRLLEGTERAALMSRSGPHPDLLDEEEIMRTGWVLEAAYERAPKSRDDSEHRASVLRALLALRLYKSGKIGCRAVRKTFPDSLAASVSWASLKPTAWTIFDPMVVMSEQEAADFHAFHTRVHEALSTKEKSLVVALSRFEDAYKRDSPEDGLIDHVICLEALLLPGIRGELRFRFALRGAILLAQTIEERPRLYEDLLDAYNQRSALVHGAQVTLAEAKVARVEELARKALVEALTLAAASPVAYPKLMDRIEQACLLCVTPTDLATHATREP